MQITTVSVTIGDGVRKTEDYTPPRKAEVTISATVAEGENGEAALDHCATVANRKVTEIVLNRKPAAAGPKTEGAAGQQTGSPSPVAVAAPSAPTDKDRLADAAGVPAAAAPEKRKPGRPPSAAKSAAEKVQDNPLADLEGGNTTAPAGENDDLAALMGEAPLPPVTDAALAKAVQATALRLKGVTKPIHTLAAEYGGGPVPKTLRDIPADKRHRFVQALDTLTA